MDKKNYDLDSMVIFDSPIRLKDEPPFYGFLFSAKWFLRDEHIEPIMQDYMAYVYGAEKWLSEGCDIDEKGFWWGKGEKEVHYYREKEILDYCAAAYKNNYTIMKNCKPVVKQEHLNDDGIFIISEEYKNWEMEGEV